MVVGMVVAAVGMSGCANTATGPRDSSPTASGGGSSSPSPAAVDPRPAAVTTLPPAATSTPGCASPSQPAPRGGTTGVYSLTVDGKARSYRLHVPVGYDPAAAGPAPMVLSMHGMGGNAATHLLFTGVTSDADANGYVVIAPEAVGGMWDLPAADGSEGVRTPELAYLDDVLADAGSRLCLDPTRYYASGMSLGSAMTLVLACQPERRFAAFGGVGASFYDNACNDAPPAPLIYFHGTDDDVVPFEGGQARGFLVEPVTETMDAWATHNACAKPPSENVTDDVILTTWATCTNNAAIDFATIVGGGHTWPGSPLATSELAEQYLGPTTATVSANAAMWQFFSRYSLPAAVSGG